MPITVRDVSDPGPEGGRDGGAESSDLQKTERLVLDELSDRLDTLKLLRAGSADQADAILEQFGAKGKVEAEMLDQIAQREPLLHPERFQEAHRTVMHALEVFDRNGARPPSRLRAGFLRPLATPLVQILIRVIVRDYERTVVDRIHQMYARRWASSEPGTREFGMLRLARLEVERLEGGYKKSAGGLPTFLVGGAALSGVASALQGALLKAAGSDVVLVAVAVGFALLALGAFWCIFNAAAIARRRTRIALDQPLHALWETVGAAGRPPRDQSRQFAIYSAILLLIAWLVVPIALGVAATR